MEAKLILSILITIFSLGLTLIGIPAQVIKNHKEKRSGQPMVTVLIALGFYASQIALFVVTQTYLPLISFGFGFLMWGVILVQHFIYKKEA